MYAILLLILWYALRILLMNATISRPILFGGIVAIGCMLSIWGLLQLYGLQPSNHRLFAITGPFYNPGPYSGYLATIFVASSFRFDAMHFACRDESFGMVSFVL